MPRANGGRGGRTGGNSRRNSPGRSSSSKRSQSRPERGADTPRSPRNTASSGRGGKSFGDSEKRGRNSGFKKPGRFSDSSSGKYNSSDDGEKKFDRSKERRSDSRGSGAPKRGRGQSSSFGKRRFSDQKEGNEKFSERRSSGKRPTTGDSRSRSRDDFENKRPTRSSSTRSNFRGRDDGEKKFSRGKSSGRSRRDDDRQERTPRDENKGFFNKQSREPKFRGQPDQDVAAPVQTEKIRLNRYIANSGVCSRREADELISMGLISVNGKTVTELGFKVNPGDEVRYENRVLRAEKPVYILMNKPKGFLTTTEDPQERDTVMHIIGSAVKERIYPVGRLDRNTTGLLLLTNDGDLADKLMHPSYNAKKIYKVDLDRPLTKADFQKIIDGVRLEEGVAMVDDLAIVSEDGKTVGVEIHIGWNRVVRRIFESLDYQVVRLDRSVYAGLDKKDLARGQWRFLTKEEIVRLKHFK